MKYIHKVYIKRTGTYINYISKEVDILLHTYEYTVKCNKLTHHSIIIVIIFKNGYFLLSVIQTVLHSYYVHNYGCIYASNYIHNYDVDMYRQYS